MILNNMKKIQWKQSIIDYDKLNEITHKSLVSSQEKSTSHKKKISESHKGKTLSKEHLENLKKTNNLFGDKPAWNKDKTGYKTKPHSIETKQKMSEKAKGRVISQKQKKDISKKLSIPIIATNLKTGKQKEYKSQKDAADKLGLTGILHVLKGRSKQCGGYYFEYKK